MQMITGLTSSTFQKLELDAGIFCLGLDWSAVTDAASLATAIASAKTAGNYMGATKGGGTFSATPTTREIEADGVRAAFVGSTRNDGWQVKMSTTLLEFTADNFKRALGAGDVETSGNITKITARTDYETTDYISKVQWIGNLSNGDIALIEIDNALSVGGMSFTFTDKGEGTIPLELLAHQGDVLNQTKAPFTIAIIKKAATTSGTGSSAAEG